MDTKRGFGVDIPYSRASAELTEGLGDWADRKLKTFKGSALEEK